MKNDLPFVPTIEESTVEFLLLVRRNLYQARLTTATALHLANTGEWGVELIQDHVVVTFPKGRIIDPQNRAFVTEMLKVRPARIVLPHGYPMSVSSLGSMPRYYVRLRRGCSLTVESALEIKP